MNHVFLIGRPTKDIELKSTANGTTVCTFNLAVRRDKETVDFIQCTAFSGTAELLARYVKKGNLVSVHGRLTVRSFEKDGKTVYVSEVIVKDVYLLGQKPKEETPEDDLPY